MKAMTLSALRRHCEALPGATANVQWGNDLVFKVGGKMFATIYADAKTDSPVSFKASPESFEILTRADGIAPARYLARAKWVTLESVKNLPANDLKEYLTRSHALVAGTLTRKARAELGIG